MKMLIIPIITHYKHVLIYSPCVPYICTIYYLSMKNKEQKESFKNVLLLP